MEKTIFVIFGVTGDLAKRKLFPALYCLYKEKRFTDDFYVLGVGRKEKNQNELEEDVKKSLVEFSNCTKENIENDFLEKFSYLQVEFDKLDSYLTLKERINKLENESMNQVIFYLAIPPRLFFPVLENINSSELNLEKSSVKKIVFEKPFGENLKSARKLNSALMKVFDENQVYRIDHYLGKEAVQNFLVLRFANHFLEPLWNNRHIDNVQVTAFEKLGVESRGSYYDSSGALRDMMQNHLFQMLSLIAMEPPTNLNPEAIRDEKIKIFSAIKSLEGAWEKSVIFGQYGKGIIDGKEVKTYKEEDGVNKDSRTETFVSLKLEIDNWRWAGVPFYLRTGKRLKEKGTMVVIEFKKIPSILYNKENSLKSNKLIIKIQPDESIQMQFNVKAPGEGNRINNVLAEFDHKKLFGNASPEAYEKLLMNIIKGDQTLFTRWDGVEESWKIIDKLLDCRDNCPMIFSYESGSYGPKESDKLLENDSRKWHNF